MISIQIIFDNDAGDEDDGDDDDDDDDDGNDGDNAHLMTTSSPAIASSFSSQFVITGATREDFGEV